MRWVKEYYVEVLVTGLRLLLLAGVVFAFYYDYRGHYKTRLKCIEYEACRCCKTWAADEDIAEKPVIPADACP